MISNVSLSSCLDAFILQPLIFIAEIYRTKNERTLIPMCQTHLLLGSSCRI